MRLFAELGTSLAAGGGSPRRWGRTRSNLLQEVERRLRLQPYDCHERVQGTTCHEPAVAKESAVRGAEIMLGSVDEHPVPVFRRAGFSRSAWRTWNRTCRRMQALAEAENIDLTFFMTDRAAAYGCGVAIGRRQRRDERQRRKAGDDRHRARLSSRGRSSSVRRRGGSRGTRAFRGKGEGFARAGGRAMDRPEPWGWTAPTEPRRPPRAQGALGRDGATTAAQRPTRRTPTPAVTIAEPRLG
jgi:hypothetical protein